jgi:hypothetical protein
LATTKSTALQAGIDHVVDGVAARAAYAEDRDARLQLLNVGHLQVDGHIILATHWCPRYGRTLFFPNFHRRCRQFGFLDVVFLAHLVRSFP